MEINFPSEKFIEDYVFDCIERGACSITDEQYDIVMRQVSLGVYGIADIVAANVDFSHKSNQIFIEIVVYELKNEPLKSRDYGQLSRYMSCIKYWLDRYSDKLKYETYLSVRGVLAGLKSREDDFVLLNKYICQSIDTFYLSLDMRDGFNSSEVGREWYRAGRSLNDVKSIFSVIKEAIRDGGLD